MMHSMSMRINREHTTDRPSHFHVRSGRCQTLIMSEIRSGLESTHWRIEMTHRTDEGSPPLELSPSK